MEVCVAYYESRKFINRGFLTGPICPIYGFGGVLVILFLSKYKDSIFVLYFMSIVIASILEYFTSYLMEKIFKNRWWDYSHLKYNINGRICLETMVPFGFLALFTVHIFNPQIFRLLSLINISVLRVIALSLVTLTLFDIILSFNIIITLKNVSNSLRCDSTEIITKKVKEILFNKTILHRRLVLSFPYMRIFNKKALLKEKIKREKKRLKEAKLRLKKQRKKH